MQGLDKKRLALAVAFCLIAIGVAVYMGVHTFSQPPVKYPKDFARYGPSGPPDARSMPPGSAPGFGR